MELTAPAMSLWAAALLTSATRAAFSTAPFEACVIEKHDAEITNAEQNREENARNQRELHRDGAILVTNEMPRLHWMRTERLTEFSKPMNEPPPFAPGLPPDCTRTLDGADFPWARVTPKF